MALPKISTPILSFVIPSTQEIKKFRPFLVKEEKILLLAQQGEDTDSLLALKQVITNCCHDNIDVDKLTTFDIEYLFLKLRSKSVNNVVKLRYRDKEDDKIYDFEVNLDEVEIKINPEHSNKIQINEELGMIFKYPDVNLTNAIGKVETADDLFTKVVIYCIDSIYDKDKVYSPAEYTEEELIEFIDQLDHATFEKIQKFFDTMPKLYHELNYTNEMGNARTIKLESVKDFFILG
jgi:hypothetical protein